MGSSDNGLLHTRAFHGVARARCLHWIVANVRPGCARRRRLRVQCERNLLMDPPSLSIGLMISSPSSWRVFADAPGVVWLRVLAAAVHAGGDHLRHGAQPLCGRRSPPWSFQGKSYSQVRLVGRRPRRPACRSICWRHGSRGRGRGGGRLPPLSGPRLRARSLSTTNSGDALCGPCASPVNTPALGQERAPPRAGSPTPSGGVPRVSAPDAFPPNPALSQRSSRLVSCRGLGGGSLADGPGMLSAPGSYPIRPIGVSLFVLLRPPGFVAWAGGERTAESSSASAPPLLRSDGPHQTEGATLVRWRPPSEGWCPGAMPVAARRCVAPRPPLSPVCTGEALIAAAVLSALCLPALIDRRPPGLSAPGARRLALGGSRGQAQASRQRLRSPSWPRELASARPKAEREPPSAAHQACSCSSPSCVSSSCPSCYPASTVGAAAGAAGASWTRGRR